MTDQAPRAQLSTQFKQAPSAQSLVENLLYTKVGLSIPLKQSAHLNKRKSKYFHQFWKRFARNFVIFVKRCLPDSFCFLFLLISAHPEAFVFQ